MAITRRFKSYFLRGLAVLLPTILTIWIFIWGYKFIQGNISVYINHGLVRLIMLTRGIDWHNVDARKPLVDFWMYGWGSITGFVVALVIVLVVGLTLASVLGRTLWRTIEKFIMNTPFLRQVYPYIKQITDFLLKPEEQEKLFSRVVLVEFPRKGLWAIGMVTGPGIKKIVDEEEKEFLTVFIAHAPSPITGFVVLVPKDEVIDAGMTIEEALRFIVSGGVISPLREQSALPQAGSAVNK